MSRPRPESLWNSGKYLLGLLFSSNSGALARAELGDSVFLEKLLSFLPDNVKFTQQQWCCAAEVQENKECRNDATIIGHFPRMRTRESGDTNARAHNIITTIWRKKFPNNWKKDLQLFFSSLFSFFRPEPEVVCTSSKQVYNNQQRVLKFRQFYQILLFPDEGWKNWSPIQGKAEFRMIYEWLYDIWYMKWMIYDIWMIIW